MNFPQPSSVPATSEAAPQKLPLFLRISIAALVVIGFITIITLFIESIDHRAERITATFLLFAAFTGLTALDTFRGSARSWYGPAALVSNIWALAASLIVIWLLPAERFSGLFPRAVGLSILIVVIVRLALLLSLWVLNRIEERTKLERGFGYSATAALVLAAAVYSGYLAVESVFGARLEASFGILQMEAFWDVWLKIGTSALIVGALCTSVTLLLRWFYGADEREQIRQQLLSQRGVNYPPNNYPMAQRQQLNQVVEPTQYPTSQRTQTQQPLLPWPVHPDGVPYAAGPDGQPDFAAARQRDEAMGNHNNWRIS